MTILYLLVYGAIMWYIYTSFKNTLIPIEVENQDGGTTQVFGLTNGHYLMIVLAIVLTGFTFWFIGRNSLAYLLYY